LAWLGVELYGFTVKGLAEILDQHFETVSRLVSRAAMRRVEDWAFRERIQRVDSVIAQADGDGRRAVTLITWHLYGRSTAESTVQPPQAPFDR